MKSVGWFGFLGGPWCTDVLEKDVISSELWHLFLLVVIATSLQVSLRGPISHCPFFHTLLSTHHLIRTHSLPIVQWRLQWDPWKHGRLAHWSSLCFSNLPLCPGDGPWEITSHLNAPVPFLSLLWWGEEGQSSHCSLKLPPVAFYRALKSKSVSLFPDSPIFMSVMRSSNAQQSADGCSACSVWRWVWKIYGRGRFLWYPSGEAGSKHLI